MIDVYWSPWSNMDIYEGCNMIYDDPYPLAKYYNSLMEKNNLHDNFLKCPAHVNYTKNIFCLPQPFDIDVVIENGQLIDVAKNKASNLNHFYQMKAPSLVGKNTINIYSNWIFFSEEPLILESMPAFMHNTGLQNSGFYVPGTFDISKWFRPLEGAIQLWDGVTTIKCNAGDPLFYARFMTDEKIRLRRFNLTPEIREISKACMHVKRYKTIKNLDKLYEMFQNRGKHRQLLNLIEQNLVE